MIHMKTIAFLLAFLSAPAFAGTVQFYEWSKDNTGYRGFKQPIARTIYVSKGWSGSDQAEVRIIVEKEGESVVEACTFTAETLQEAGFSIGEFMDIMTSENDVYVACDTGGSGNKYARIMQMTVEPQQSQGFEQSW
jgi:hypothetical protein